MLQVRILTGKKHLLRFCRYATCVQYPHGPCRGILSSIQYKVIAVIAVLKSILSNLTELAWEDSDVAPTSSILRLLKYFVSPRVTTVSLSCCTWPVFDVERPALAGLPILFPRVASFPIVSCYYPSHLPQPQVTS